MRYLIAIAILLAALAFWFTQVDRAEPSTAALSAGVTNLAIQPPDGDFKQVFEPVPFEFPRDHGPHPDYRSEWWYYTGNLAAADGSQFGYQFTIFRRGITPGPPDRASEWGTRQVWFAHFTVTDGSGGTFNFAERFSRGSPNLAGAQGQPGYHVWLDNWEAREIEPGVVRLRANGDGMAVDLRLEQAKPAALQGDRGVSAKSNQPGNASYYYSLTNNPTTGTVTTPRGTFAVTGNSWMDREWSSSLLDEDAVGWDWFSLHLDDNRELMFYSIRRADGSAEPASAGIIVQPDGSTTYLSLADVQIENLDFWTSPHSGATYPAKWRLAVPAHNIDLTITPLISDQELRVSFTYWEGAVTIEGSHT
ncbi:MAG: carotenoid 1,2-hydratase, partial [Chloroflexi bacterium]